MYNSQIPFDCDDNIDIFDEKEILNNDALKQKIAKKRWNKYFKYFNSTDLLQNL
jgi:hypothetical protein|tara:strand:+ start:721 stop:882 length:162 start_codon:yes stop_codon:yes gene_type:complete